MDNSTDEINEESIAIIGMSGRFPGAKNIEDFWQNLKNGVESIRFFSDQELIESGIDPALLKDNNYVKAKGVLDNVAEFDAAFFGLSPKEAEITDPQQRLFLECAWEALENAGYDPKAYPGAVGIYGGVGGFNTYLLENLHTNHALRKTIGDYKIGINNNNDFVCTQVSYKLNLRGPGVSVQTACSTSLVAVAMGYQSLLDYQCDLVLAGGAAITLPQKSGYLYQEGMILSPDGHCRAFDANAQGTVSGNGVGIVVLKRLREALAEGDTIHAVIRGAAINNDGALKVGYMAPSVDAQTRVIAEALTLAEISPETISYIETHGTGTPVGDLIEITALTQAFRAKTAKKGYCAIGSVKTNIGHLDAASGVTGLIKAVLALKHQLIPPSLHFETPNPKLDLANSPFYVNTKLSAWETAGIPRRAAVNSFGVGGTNAHLILEEAPAPKLNRQPPTRPWQLLLLSARTDTALEAATTQLVDHLKHHPDINLADVAYTYQLGRRLFNHRRMLVCQTVEDTVNALETREAQRVLSQTVKSHDEPTMVFMFSGQGAQYVNMGLELYQTEPVFREQIDHCAELLKPQLGLDLRTLLYPNDKQHTYEAAVQQLKQTALTQPALFVIEYALAQLWQSWGVHPNAMIGHSIGEYVAACLAGVLTLEQALTIVAERGRLIQTVPAGAMLAVPLAETEIRPLLNHQLDLAAINISSQSVVAGTLAAVAQLVVQLAEQGVECQRLQTSHAFHSEMMVSILPDFLNKVQKIQLQPPQIPFISNVTGTWISDTEATDPNYWVKHLRQTVRFAAGLQPILEKPQPLLLEVGPGRTLSTFAKRHPDNIGQLVLTSLRHPKEEQSDSAFILNTLGQLWMAGITVNGSGFYANEQRYRLPLPTYPFERQRYWLEPIDVQKPVPQKITASQLWQSLIKKAHQQAQQDIAKFDNPAYADKYQQLDRLCATYVNLALNELGAFANYDEQYSAEELLTQFHISPFYRQMLPRCLNALVKQGQLQRQGEKFTNLIPVSADSFKALVEEVKAKWIETPEWFELVQLCGGKLAAILTGKENPRELLFTGSAFDTLQSLYQNSPESRYFATIMHVLIRELLKSLPADTYLRILEIGAGTGATTAYLLPELPAQRTHYVYTDVGSSFLEQARHKFANYPFIEYRVLNIDQNPIEQGYESHHFDIVVAAQVLHATQNLGKVLEHVRSLLAPEGLMVLWESITPEVLYFDIVFPFLQPFAVNDILRSQYPFLTIAQWHDALRKYGFVEVEYFPENDVFDDRVFVAQASSEGAAPIAFTNKAHQQNIAQISEEKSERATLSKSTHPRPELSQSYVAARNTVEQTMAESWQDFFDIEQVGIHDDFFELGGDSLLAVQLSSKLRKRLQTDISSQSLLDSPTIAKLAELIPTTLSRTNLDSAIPSLLVKLKSGHTERTPLFLIPPGGGTPYAYRDLANCLAPPVYGIHTPGRDGKTQPLTQFEEMANHYIKALRVVQPTGPYCLGGASFGGMVAFEMAQQLHALGEKIALLALIDAPCPTHFSIETENEYYIKALAYSAGLTLNPSLPVSSEYFNQLGLDEQAHYLFEHSEVVNTTEPESVISHIRNVLQVAQANEQALKNYVPKTYPGRILFFRASDLELVVMPPHPETSWSELIMGGIDFHEVPGNHFTMLSDPHVEVMAELLTKYLNILGP